MSRVVGRLIKEDNLLDDLNTIANFAIGNQPPEDVSFNERDTLPEAISFIVTYPENERAVREALQKAKQLNDMTTAFYKKIVLMKTKIELKRKKL